MPDKTCKLTGILLISFFIFFTSCQQQATFYVSPSGNDASDGSLNHPFATLDRARTTVREILKEGTKRNITVFFRQGRYGFQQTFELDGRDSGENGSTITYQAYPNEQVIFHGGVYLPANTLRPIQDSLISKRMITRVMDKIVCLSYAGINIDEGELPERGFGRPYQIAPMELFCGDRAFRLGRWPNTGQMAFTRVIDHGSLPLKNDSSHKGGIIVYDISRPQRWANCDDVWISGYFCYGFANDVIPVKRIDPEKKEITTSAPAFYGFEAGKPFSGFYAFNLLEEIDEPGEYYIDKKNKMIYLYPYPDSEKQDYSLSVLKDPMIAVEGASNICFDHITFECTRGMGVYIEGGNGIHIRNSTFRNIGTVAICIGKGVLPGGNDLPASRVLGKRNEYLYGHNSFNTNGGKNHLIENCEIFNTGTGGIILTGGDRHTLERGNNRISNCSIHDYNRLEQSYRPGIEIEGVGNTIDHCNIYNAPAAAIILHGNDHTIEYNNIFEVVREGHDMGALYYGRNPSERGSEVRYNFFHHIGGMAGGSVGIYHDDGACGMKVISNIFYKVGTSTVMVGGGTDIYYSNNIFIDAPLAVHLDNRLENWAKEFIADNGVYRTRLEDIGFNRPPYSKRYPELAAYWTDNPEKPKRILFENNLFYAVTEICNGKPEWGEFKNNLVTNTEPLFRSTGRLDFNLLPQSPVWKSLPDFKPIPLNDIGRKMN